MAAFSLQEPAWLERWFLPIGLGILVLAAALRVPELGLNPFHHDEGINGFFETNLLTKGEYRYDPANYHGPALYYLALVPGLLLGLTTEAMRLVPVLAGIGAAALVLPFRRYLGSVAVLTGAALLALSPGMVYVSRYFIHEMPLVAFTLGLLVSALRYRETGRSAYLYTGAASAALMFTTKETAIITIAVLAIAAWLSGVYMTLRSPAGAGWRPAAARSGSSREVRTEAGAPIPQSIWVDGIEYRPATTGGSALPIPPARSAGFTRGSGRPGAGGFGGDRPAIGDLIGPAVVFAAIWVVLFSSFFGNAKGLTDSLASFAFWSSTASQTQVHPVYRYLEWMARGDTAILALGVVGGLLVAFRPRDRMSAFVGLWAAGITAAYSIPQYKTPWITVNMLVPLALLGGILVRELAIRASVRVAAPVLLAVALGASGYQAFNLNYVHYDDETYPYVYVHTTREAVTMIAEIHAGEAKVGLAADGSGTAFFSPDYWPMPWYLPKAEYWAQIYEPPILEQKRPMVVIRVDQEAQLSADFKAAYVRRAEYLLRPGVRLVLFLRRDAFGL